MSVFKWAYDPDYCDGDICIGDCDYCRKIVTMYYDAIEACKKELERREAHEMFMSLMEEENDES